MKKTSDAARITRTRIRITGVVQGVGFRPFVFRLSKDLGLKGFVQNSGAGVVLEVEGAIDPALFIQRLSSEAPPNARIERVETETLPLKKYFDFVILESVGPGAEPPLISPDISICDDCTGELFDPANRRYRYPFINCTNCGPRYSIIQGLPYDRPKTTMAGFNMCAECRREYDDPLDRRFHAQPNACERCGPKAWLEGAGLYNVSAIERAQELLMDGAIVAIKGLGGFHLACDATNDAAVKRLRSNKRGSQKPFAVMSPDTACIRKFALVRAGEEALLSSRERPITLLEKSPGLETLSKSVAPQNRYYGTMLPYTPLHHLTCRGFTALVMTSANFSEEPIITTNEEALGRLKPLADYFLLHDRPIFMRVDDSIAKKTGRGKTMLLRRSRGFAPESIDLGDEMQSAPKVLAFGALLKNTFAITSGRHAILSQHIGDLENERAVGFSGETLCNLKSAFDIKPEAVAMDLHPDYRSTGLAESYADENAIPLERRMRVQHHHAHVASVMAEHGLKGPVIGVAFDGAGFGPDQAIWGGEMLVATLLDFKRAAHLKYVPLPGGDAAAREPWRMAVSHLHGAFGKDFPAKLLSGLDRKKTGMVAKMIESNVNSPLTSSVGRLFDAVSAMLGLSHVVTYEGEAAVALERAATSFMDNNVSILPAAYDFRLVENSNNELVLDLAPMIMAIADDVLAKREVGRIAMKFHFTLVSAVVEIAKRIRERAGINVAALGGGVFQNALFLDETVNALEKDGFSVYHNERVPPNDGGIALGQAIISAALCRRSK
jgi:hydrogenase maturation protein HypF